MVLLMVVLCLGVIRCDSGTEQKTTWSGDTHSLSLSFNVKGKVQLRVRFLSPGLLQLTVLRRLWGTNEPPAISSERYRQSGCWHTMLKPHIAGAPAATLATGTPARRFQGTHTRIPVAVRYLSTVPGRRLPSCCRYS